LNHHSRDHFWIAWSTASNKLRGVYLNSVRLAIAADDGYRAKLHAHNITRMAKKRRNSGRPLSATVRHGS
jgi:hypothetical protein